MVSWRRRIPIYALLSANAVSQLGNSITNIAVPWFVLQTTGSTAKLGLTGGAIVLAQVLAGILGGPMVDRLGHKRVSIVADLASGVTVAMIPLLHHTIGIAFWQLLLLVFLGGILDTPGNTARISLIPNLSDMAAMRLERANSASEGIGHLSLLVGPPVGGLLIAFLGPSNVLWLDAATFAVSALIVLLAVPSARAEHLDTETGRAGGYLSELAEGLRFIRTDRLIFSILIIAMIANFLFGPLTAVVMPTYADSIYGSALNLGLMLAGFGIGALAGTIFYGAVGHHLPRRMTLVVTCFVFGLPFWVLVATPPLPVSAGALAVTGATLGVLNPLLLSVEQERVSQDMLGRVIGADIALSSVASPLGIVLAGFMLEVVSLRLILIGISTCFVIVGLLAYLNPIFREMDTYAAKANTTEAKRADPS